MEKLEGAGQWPGHFDGGTNWVDHLRRDDISVGTYSVPAGGVDDQDPHTEDEIYVITAGRAVLTGPEGSIPAEPGSVLFVPANEEHRFEQITEDLVAIVVFGPAEYSRARKG